MSTNEKGAPGSGLREAAQRVVDEYRTDLRAGRWSDALLAAMDELREVLAAQPEAPPESAPAPSTVAASPPAETAPRKMTCPHGIDTMNLCGDCWASAVRSLVAEARREGREDAAEICDRLANSDTDVECDPYVFAARRIRALTPAGPGAADESAHNDATKEE